MSKRQSDSQRASKRPLFHLEKDTSAWHRTRARVECSTPPIPKLVHTVLNKLSRSSGWPAHQHNWSPLPSLPLSINIFLRIVLETWHVIQVLTSDTIREGYMNYWYVFEALFIVDGNCARLRMAFKFDFNGAGPAFPCFQADEPRWYIELFRCLLRQQGFHLSQLP